MSCLCAQGQPVDIAGGSATLCSGVDEPLHPRPPAPGQRLRRYSHAAQPAGHQVRQTEKRMIGISAQIVYYSFMYAALKANTGRSITV